MIHNDQEMKATEERIAYFYRLLAQLRVTASTQEFPAVASGYRAEIARMQEEVLDCLARHSGEPAPLEAA
jgi:hypothetical protein